MVSHQSKLFRPIIYLLLSLIFPKVKGLEREPEVVNFEQFITVKGIKAQGNQLDNV